MITRFLDNEIASRLTRTQKIIVLFGARQTGKTTLCNSVINKTGLRAFKVNADQLKYIDVFSSRDLRKMEALIDGYQLLFIDEAHRIPDIGMNLKILHDEYPELKILVTGSSSFELAKRVTEPLTGRKIIYQLFPISYIELKKFKNTFELNEILDESLVFGCYPEVVTTKSHSQKKEILEEITDSYLFKDILEFTSIRHRNKIRELLRLLAFQVGSEISIHELSKTTGLNHETVEKYIYLLEESFIVFRLSGFSRNLRKEISKMDKIYFYDLGIRNSLINNLNPPNLRNDIGELWENFIITERLKYISYYKIRASRYFWRTYTGAELDYVEERDGELFGYEIKYKKNKLKPPKTWIDVYDGKYSLINSTNYLAFVT